MRLHVHPPAETQEAVDEYCKVGELPSVGVVKAGCLKQLKLGLSHMPGNRPVRFYGADTKTRQRVLATRLLYAIWQSQ